MEHKDDRMKKGGDNVALAVAVVAIIGINALGLIMWAATGR